MRSTEHIQTYKITRLFRRRVHTAWDLFLSFLNSCCDFARFIYIYVTSIIRLHHCRAWKQVSWSETKRAHFYIHQDIPYPLLYPSRYLLPFSLEIGIYISHQTWCHKHGRHISCPASKFLSRFLPFLCFYFPVFRGQAKEKRKLIWLLEISRLFRKPVTLTFKWNLSKKFDSGETLGNYTATSPDPYGKN